MSSATVKEEKVAWNIVVAANQFDPMAFNYAWLVSKGIVPASEVSTNTPTGDTSNPSVAQFATDKFNLLVLPPMLQFAPKPDIEDEGNIVATTLKLLLQSVQVQSFNAIGLNFTWHLTPSGDSVNAISKQLFFRSGAPFSSFDDPEARFGAYLSRQYHNSRLRLDIKPIALSLPGGKEEGRLQLAFNFHKDLDPDRNQSLKDMEAMLSRWGEAQEYARSIVAATVRDIKQA